MPFATPSGWRRVVERGTGPGEMQQAADGSLPFSLVRVVVSLLLPAGLLLALPYIALLSPATAYFVADGTLPSAFAGLDRELVDGTGTIPLDTELAAHASLIVTMVNAVVLALFVSASWALLARPIRGAALVVFVGVGCCAVLEVGMLDGKTVRVPSLFPVPSCVLVGAMPVGFLGLSTLTMYGLLEALGSYVLGDDADELRQWALCGRHCCTASRMAVAGRVGQLTTLVATLSSIAIPLYLRATETSSVVTGTVLWACAIIASIPNAFAFVTEALACARATRAAPAAHTTAQRVARITAVTSVLVSPFLSAIVGGWSEHNASACPAFFFDQDAPVPATPWPLECNNSECFKNIQGFVTSRSVTLWSSAGGFLVCTLIVILSAQANVAATRERDAQHATAKMRQALQYISHEARAPLGGAILSMGLLDQAMAAADESQASLLISDLHLSLEAAQRQLTDLLMFDESDSGEGRGVAWRWSRLDGPHLSRLRSSFAGACKAEGIALDIRVQADLAPTSLPVQLVEEHWNDDPPITAEPAQREHPQAADADCDSGADTPAETRDAPPEGKEHAAASELADAPRPSAAAAGDRTPPRPGSPGAGGASGSAGDSKRVSPNAGEASGRATAASTVQSSPQQQLRLHSSGSRAPSSALGSRGTDASSGDAELYIDVERVLAIVQNALSNSIKHVRGDGTGRISVLLTLGPASDLPGRDPAQIPTARAQTSSSTSQAAGQRPSVDVSDGHASHRNDIRTLQHGASSLLGAGGIGGGPGGPGAPSVLGRSATVSRTNREDCGSPRRRMHSVGLEPASNRRRQLAGTTGVVQGVAGSGVAEPASTGLAGVQKRVLWIEVLDNGKGIPSSVLRPGRLFRPFQQLRQGDGSLRMTSSGLGLSIVKSVVVEQLQGIVGLASREGEGTLFTAKIPVWARSASAAFASTATLNTGAGRALATTGSVRLSDSTNPGSEAAAGTHQADSMVVRSGHAAPSFKRGASNASAKRSLTSVAEEGASVNSASDAEAVKVVRARVPRDGAATSPPSPAGSDRFVMAFETDAPAKQAGGPGLSMAPASTCASSAAAKAISEATSLPSGRPKPTIITTGLPVTAAADRADTFHRPSSFQAGSPKPAAGRRAKNADRKRELSRKLRTGRRERPAKAVLGSAFVVDDERVNRTLMARVVRSWGFKVEGMENGAELVDAIKVLAAKDIASSEAALAAAAADKSPTAGLSAAAAAAAAATGGTTSSVWPTVITLDIQMPVMDGFGALAALRTLAEEHRAAGHSDVAERILGLVIIGVTGNAVISDRLRMLKLGARKVLTKPVDVPDLAALVQSCCGVELPARAHRRVGQR
ncbi:hypothetical protein FNF31_05218 [Cafeteria roenbergensis]|uniref:histidine kinase n=1 Tax=Cafeteria roenbergensis TaxID=33653 RepID=A0A5A8D2F6_CAFRO|nr:hypothetical protein FNF31_05218 [Cafeteria roenbergensis]